MRKTLGLSLAAICLLAVPGTAWGGHRQDYTYTVVQGDEPIGYFRFKVAPKSDAIEITADGDLKVEFGPLTLFEFRHRRRELWRDGELEESIAYTKKNDDFFNIRITREAGGYKRVVNGREDRFSDPVKVLAMWHEDLFTHSLFISPLEDKLYRLSVVPMGAKRIRLGDRWVETQHYSMTGDSERELWFDQTGHVVKVRLYDYGAAIDYVLDDGTIRAKLASRPRPKPPLSRDNGR